MTKKDLIEKSPLRIFNQGIEGEIVSRRMGLVIARAGLGKTAILVQIALDGMLRGNQIVHVSIGSTLDKTKAWYDDIFMRTAGIFRLENADEIRNEIMRNRMIITFNASTFNRPKLEERLNDLIFQDIFHPDCLLVDGLDFNVINGTIINDMRQLMTGKNLDIWFSAVSHREDSRVSKNGVPAPCHETDDLFDTIILLEEKPEIKSVTLNILKDNIGHLKTGEILNLDPVTHMIKEV